MNVIYPFKKQLYFVVLSCGTRKDSMWHAFSYVNYKGSMKKKFFSGWHSSLVDFLLFITRWWVVYASGKRRCVSRRYSMVRKYRIFFYGYVLHGS